MRKDAGLARPKSQDVEDFAREISPERIKDADGDAIFVTEYADEKGLSAKTAAQFKANPLWTPLAPKVHEVPDLTWMTAVGLQGAWMLRPFIGDPRAEFRAFRNIESNVFTELGRPIWRFLNRKDGGDDRPDMFDGDRR